MSSRTSTPPVDLDDLDAALAAMQKEREELGEQVTRAAPSVSAWSSAQHLYHVALATDLALRNVRSLCARKGRLITMEGGPTGLALEVLEAGTYPRGESEAPRMVQAPDEVDLSFLEMEMKGNRDAADQVRLLLEQIPDAPGFIPHHVLGGLSAGHWLRFAAMHARHHLAIVRDIRAELG